MDRRSSAMTAAAAIVGTTAVITVAVPVGLFGAFTATTRDCDNPAQSGGTILVQPATFDSTAQGWSQSQLDIANQIVGIGLARGFSQRDVLIALMVAMQESQLKNVPLGKGDRDSAGIYQQRTSQGWGTIAQIMNPVYAINKFYDTLNRVENREAQSLLDVALKVQRPSRAAYLDRRNYFPGWEDDARAILAQGDTSTITTSVSSGTYSQTVVDTSACANAEQYGSEASAEAVVLAIEAATRVIGTPYQWGENSTGGFDFSGLTSWAYAQAGVTLPRDSRSQYRGGTKVARADLLPGDLVYYASNPNDPSTINYVSLYVGNNQRIFAPHSKAKVSKEPMQWDGFIGATRPVSVPAGEFGPVAVGDGWQLPLGTGLYRKTSPFGWRTHPIFGDRRLHAGQDYGAPSGTPVYAVADGVVNTASYQGGAGNTVRIVHSGGVQTGYLHLNSFAPGIRPGIQVKRGDLIARVGSSGNSTGPHLHFEVNNGRGVTDPIAFLRARGVNA